MVVGHGGGGGGDRRRDGWGVRSEKGLKGLLGGYVGLWA